MIRRILGLVSTGLAAACQTLPAVDTTSLETREGIAVDGIVSPGEWSDAPLAPAGTEGALLVREDGEFLYLCVRAGRELMANVYLLGSEQLHVLHAARSLERFVYRRATDGRWLLSEQSTATIGRDAAAEALAAHLAEHGWTASTTAMGNPLDAEFKISLEYLADRPVIAVSSFDTLRINHWPRGAQIAPPPDELQLFSGTPPETVGFVPNTWLRLALSETAETPD